MKSVTANGNIVAKQNVSNDMRRSVLLTSTNHSTNIDLVNYNTGLLNIDNNLS